MASTFREKQLRPAEVRRILRRAAEIAETDPETASVERALTADELTRRASELGLPASAVARAIGAPEVPAPDAKGPWLAARAVTLEQEIPGELPLERYEQIVAGVGAAVGVEGRTEVVGKTLSWFEGRAVRPLVTIRSRDGQTTVKVEDRLDGAVLLVSRAILALLLATMGGALAMDTTRSALATAVVAAVVLIGAVLATIASSAKVIRRREAMLHRVMKQTVSLVASAAQRPAASPEPPPRARIAPAPEPSAAEALAEAEAEEPAEEPAQRASRARG